MARKIRVQYPGAIYHVMNRGDHQEKIFRSAKDRALFLQTLGQASPAQRSVRAGARKAISYVQPSVFYMLAGASPASAMDGWAE